jgi:hypothetical protein
MKHFGVGDIVERKLEQNITAGRKGDDLSFVNAIFHGALSMASLYFS